RAEAGLNALRGKGKYATVAAEARRLKAELSPEARELGLADEVEQRVKAIRQQAVRAHAADAEAVLRRLYDKGQYAEVAREGQRLAGDRKPEAEATGTWAEAGERLLGVRRQALEVRLDQARGDLEACLAREDLAGVAAGARRARAELAEEAHAV